MLYGNVKSKKSTSAIIKRESINILSSKGICPFCGRALNDCQGGYIGKNIFLPKDDSSYDVVTCCNACEKVLKTKENFTEYLERYLDEIESKINNIWNEEEK